MNTYNLNKVLKQFGNQKTETTVIKDNSFKFWIQNYIEINKPDFIAVINPLLLEPILYQINFNLEFNQGAKENIEDILNSIDPEFKNQMFKADQKAIEFFTKNNMFKYLGLIQLCFPATLIKNNPISLLREITLVPKEFSNDNILLLVAINDVTHLFGLDNQLKVNIKLATNEPSLLEKQDEIKAEINQLFQKNVNLSPREREILELIAKGKTSKEISRILFISVNTVNTHRQNLIKKFDVNSTTALINLLR